MRVLVLIWLLTGSASALGDPVRLSQLAEGERVHIVYTSRGCFHDRTFDFDFERQTGGISYRVSGRSAMLSVGEVAGLDKLLQFYRSGPAGGCTTQDVITLTAIRGGDIVSREKYLDGSCATDDMKELTRFYTLVRKLGLPLQ